MNAPHLRSHVHLIAVQLRGLTRLNWGRFFLLSLHEHFLSCRRRLNIKQHDSRCYESKAERKLSPPHRGGHATKQSRLFGNVKKR